MIDSPEHSDDGTGHADGGEQISILVVEDDVAARRLLEVTFQREAFEVVAAGDGLQAMRELLSRRFSIVVTDAVLPFVSGQEICRFVRDNAESARTPIILLSGFAADDGPSAADVRLTKPVRPEELVACVRRLLGADR